MRIKIRLRNGQSIIANSYSFGAVDCRGVFHHKNHFKLLEVLG